jgi:DNA-binding MurR/RpiR family transcriptional regulator
MEEAYASRHKNRGATLLALTDAPTSPLAPVGDITLFAPVRYCLLPDSPTAIFALADALITVVAHEPPAAVESLKDLSESLLRTFRH